MKNIEQFLELKGVECKDSTWDCGTGAPLVLDRAEGSYVYDVEGKAYIDLCAGFGALPLGHNHPSFLAGYQNIVDKKISHGLGDLFSSSSKVQLLKQVKQFMPEHLERFSLSVTGSQAVETAAKTAILKTQGDYFICFDGAYHGLDFGSLNFTSRSDFKAPFNKWLFDLKKVKRFPYEASVDKIALEAERLSGQGLNPAGVLVEPVQGRGGNRAAKISWLKKLSQFCKDFKIPLIFDEVFSGLGRAGRATFADEVAADIVCFGKAFGGGMPLSFCAGTKDLMDSWPDNRSESIHTGTFFGHPLSCRIASNTLSVISKESLIERANTLGHIFLSHANDKLSRSDLVKEIRGVGLMIAIEFKKPSFGFYAMTDLLDLGVIAIPCGERGESLSITPALNISEKLLLEGLDKICEVVLRMQILREI